MSTKEDQGESLKRSHLLTSRDLAQTNKGATLRSTWQGMELVAHLIKLRSQLRGIGAKSNDNHYPTLLMGRFSYGLNTNLYSITNVKKTSAFWKGKPRAKAPPR